MHLPTIRARQRVERDFDSRLDEIRRAGPRPTIEAAQTLHRKLAHGELALDPLDPSVVLINVGPNEELWLRTVVELTGIFLHCGPLQMRCILDVPTRTELGLDRPGAPVGLAEPAPRLQLVDPTPPAMRSQMLAAQHAAAVRVDCGCGAPAGLECRCPDEQRLATTPERQAH